MEKYLNQYRVHLGSLESFKEATMSSVVMWIKAVVGSPLVIGNMVYYFVKDKRGMEVPAYCYLRDFGPNCVFYPIYDADETCEFGWTDFDECCRIFDVIRDTISNMRNC